MGFGNDLAIQAMRMTHGKKSLAIELLLSGAVDLSSRTAVVEGDSTDAVKVEELNSAVEFTRGRAKLEASGGFTFDQAKAVASTGVDFVAVGAITHSAPVLDIGADLRTESI